MPVQKTEETQVLFLDQEDPVEEDMATHSSILACRISGREEPAGLQVHEVPKSWTQLKQLSVHTHRHDYLLTRGNCL